MAKLTSWNREHSLAFAKWNDEAKGQICPIIQHGWLTVFDESMMPLSENKGIKSQAKI